MPSYKTSTLSMLLVHYFYWLYLLIILSLCIAIFFPDAYDRVSQEKMLLIIVFWSFWTLWVWLFSAYLQRSQWIQNDKTVKTDENNTFQVIETAPEADLSFNKLDAHDTSNQ